MRISDWSSDVCSSDLPVGIGLLQPVIAREGVGAAPREHDVRAVLHHRAREADGVARRDDARHRARRTVAPVHDRGVHLVRLEEHTSELQSLMRISYAVFCLKKKIKNRQIIITIKRTTSQLIQRHMNHTK